MSKKTKKILEVLLLVIALIALALTLRNVNTTKPSPAHTPLDSGSAIELDEPSRTQSTTITDDGMIIIEEACER